MVLMVLKAMTATIEMIRSGDYGGCKGADGSRWEKTEQGDLAVLHAAA